ncbi:hypothetical protein VCHA53O466_40129 [Vibrio chagasii]|nr:hypothetical protein VCHA53O466_40129 [Vibrio chagasii]
MNKKLTMSEVTNVKYRVMGFKINPPISDDVKKQITALVNQGYEKGSFPYQAASGIIYMFEWHTNEDVTPKPKSLFK